MELTLGVMEAASAGPAVRASEDRLVAVVMTHALDLAGDEIAFPLTMALYFALGALGGLWMPPSVMPHAMQDIGQALPSNSVAELGWRITGGQASALRAVLVLTAWTVGSATAALLAYRRRNTMSVH